MTRRRLFAWAATLCLLLTPTAHAAALNTFEQNSLAHIVKQQQGKPFVLLVWSLECEFCQASLKALADAKRQGMTLAVVTLSTDSRADPQAAELMRERLAALGMQANAWAFGAAPAERLRYALDPAWHGEMPRSYWYRADGKRVAYSGMLTPQVIARLNRR